MSEPDALAQLGAQWAQLRARTHKEVRELLTQALAIALEPHPQVEGVRWSQNYLWHTAREEDGAYGWGRGPIFDIAGSRYLYGALPPNRRSPSEVKPWPKDASWLKLHAQLEPCVQAMGAMLPVVGFLVDDNWVELIYRSGHPISLSTSGSSWYDELQRLNQLRAKYLAGAS